MYCISGTAKTVDLIESIYKKRGFSTERVTQGSVIVFADPHLVLKGTGIYTDFIMGKLKLRVEKISKDDYFKVQEFRRKAMYDRKRKKLVLKKDSIIFGGENILLESEAEKSGYIQPESPDELRGKRVEIIKGEGEGLKGVIESVNLETGKVCIIIPVFGIPQRIETKIDNIKIIK
jgi:transcription antitermination factor NusG